MVEEGEAAAARGARGGGAAAGRRLEGGRRPADGKAEGKGKKEKKPKDPFADRSPLGLLKREAAERLGLVEKVYALGWGGLSSAEAGRLGALVSRLLRERGEAKAARSRR